MAGSVLHATSVTAATTDIVILAILGDPPRSIVQEPARGGKSDLGRNQKNHNNRVIAGCARNSYNNPRGWIVCLARSGPSEATSRTASLRGPGARHTPRQDERLRSPRPTDPNGIVHSHDLHDRPRRYDEP